ncbi:MAG: DNA-binding domain-containing protein [Methylocystis sp.]
MKLRELQSLFQSAVLTGDAEDATVLDLVAQSQRSDRTTLLGVYVNAYRIRLSEFLDEDYPALRVLLGDDAFEALVEEYIAANPSRQRNARWYSTQLPNYMQNSDNWRSNERVIGLALFERGLTDAFDAPDARSSTIENLAGFAPEDWPRLTFSFHPSLRILELPAGTLDIYAAATSDEEEQIPLPAEGLETVAIWRAEYDPSYRALDADEFLALNEAIAGSSFGDICQLVAFQNENQPAPERLAQFLVSWFSEGLVTVVSIAERS